MHAGYADVEITPEPGEEMTGYGYFLNRRAVGTLDPLRARALALGSGDERAVIVQLDLLGLSAEFVREVRAAVEADSGLPGTHLMLHCTHTHSGPGTMTLFGCGGPSEHFLRLLHRRIVALVPRALADLRPVTAASRFAADWPDGLAYNRVGGPELDTQVRGVRLAPAGGQPIVLLNYACHPVTLGVNREYSADYCGAVVREFNAYGVRAIFLNGCCGDVDPVSNAHAWGSGTRETLLIHGRDLAAVARRGLAQAVPCQEGPLRVASRLMPLDGEPSTLEGLRDSLVEARRALLDSPDDGARRVDVMWHETMIRKHEAGTIGDALTAEIQVIACGDVLLVGLSAETFTRLGQIIRAAAPEHHPLVAATCNGVLGYIGTAEDAEARGYASYGACKLYGMPIPAPGAGEKWASEGAELVRETLTT
jgi:hypothetical protein